MRPRISIRGSVRPSVRRLVTSYFQIPKMRYLVKKKVERTHLLVDRTCYIFFGNVIFFFLYFGYNNILLKTRPYTRLTKKTDCRPFDHPSDSDYKSFKRFSPVPFFLKTYGHALNQNLLQTGINHVFFLNITFIILLPSPPLRLLYSIQVVQLELLRPRPLPSPQT